MKLDMASFIMMTASVAESDRVSSDTTSDANDTPSSGCMTPSSPTMTIIDERGDLTLIVGTDSSGKFPVKEFQVCSRALARNSPVFAKMLFERPAEATAGQPSPPQSPLWTIARRESRLWTIALPDDDAGAMEQLFHLMHGNLTRFTVVPKFGAARGANYIRELYDFFVVAHKYDCTCLMQPWTGQLTASLEKLMAGPRLVLLMMAWIYYQLGRHSHYEKVVTQLVMASQQDAKAQFMVLPPGLLERISQDREAYIKRSLKYVRKCLDDLTSPYESLRKNYCKLNEDCGDCANRTLGALIYGLVRAELWPLPDASSVEMSPRRLHAILSGIKTLPTYSATNGSLPHLNCGIITMNGPCSLADNITSPRLSRLRSMSNLKSREQEDYKYNASDQEVHHLTMQAQKMDLVDASD